MLKLTTTIVFAFLNFSLQAQKPDYSDMRNWAAHPLIHDYSDSIPSFLKDEPRDSSVDVFFLHPTTYTRSPGDAPLNADINDAELNQLTDSRTILYQASIFNGNARVFAPRYRQASLRAYFDMGSTESRSAFDEAYDDLKTAFQYYLDHWNNNRPIIIAGHSQGSMHAIRLLKEFFDGKPLQKKLVCAYIPGWPVKKTDLKNIPEGESAAQTGCVLTWRTYQKDVSDNPTISFMKASYCINPVTWTTDNKWSESTDYKGTVSVLNFNSLSKLPLRAEVQKKDEILWVDGIDMMLKLARGIRGVNINNGNLHILDFTLFYMNVRENVKERTQAYLQKNK